MKPINLRIQRHRRKGYDMQSASRAINGLACISVTRPGRWGNPFDVRVFGRDLSLALFRNTVQGCWSPDPVKYKTDEICDLAYAAHSRFMRRLGGHSLELIRSEPVRPQSRLLLLARCRLPRRHLSRNPLWGASSMTNIPRRRAEVSGHFVQFYSRNPKLATVRWHSKFKAEYRTKAQAQAAKVEWEKNQGRIVWPEEPKKLQPSCYPRKALHGV